MLTWAEFEKVDIRTGTILEAEPSATAIKPAYYLKIDFGDLGIRKSSAQVTAVYRPEQLVGKRILAVVNFPPKQIGKFMSECLVLGVVKGEEVVLLTTERPSDNGLRVS